LEKNKKILRTDMVLFNLIMILWLALLAMLMSGSYGLNLTFYMLISALDLCMILAYNLGLMRGLIASLFFVFAYGSYLLYGVLVTGSISNVRVDYIIWLFAVPIGTYITGLLSAEINRLYWQAESNLMSDRLITIDNITGLLNERGYFRQLEEEFARSKRYKLELSVISVYTANMSEMRALYGQAGIEELVKAMGVLIEENLRTGDIKALVRMDTFAMMLTETSEDGAKIVVEKLHRALERVKVNLNGKERTIRLRVSVGNASLGANDEDPFELYNRAREMQRYDLG